MGLKKELGWTNVIDTPYVGYQVYDHDENKYFFIFTTRDHANELRDVFIAINHVYGNYQMYIDVDVDDDDYWSVAGDEFDRQMDELMHNLPKYIIVTNHMYVEDFTEIFPEQEEPDPDDPYYDDYEYQAYMYREDGSKVYYNVIHYNGKTYEIDILDDLDVSS